jgi:ferredoxin
MAETDTLRFDDRQRDNSRLSCQIELTKALDGLEVSIPAKE